MSRPNQKVLITEPNEFFYDAVSEALKEKKIRPSLETEVYLANLLKQFMSAEALYSRDQSGHRTELPLAFLVKEALEAPNEDTRKLVYRQLGDTALYMAGFFQQSLSRKAVDLDYYVGMGRAGYANVADRTPQSQRALFLELSAAFPEFVDVLSLVAESSLGHTEAELVQLYELWERTGNPQAERKLREAGILPVQKN